MNVNVYSNTCDTWDHQKQKWVFRWRVKNKNGCLGGGSGKKTNWCLGGGSGMGVSDISVVRIKNLGVASVWTYVERSFPTDLTHNQYIPHGTS